MLCGQFFRLGDGKSQCNLEADLNRNVRLPEEYD